MGSGGTDEDDPSSSVLPHYEISSSQASMYQTPRQAGSSARQPPARKHVDGRIFSYPDGQLKKHHHHHHHHKHHHHHGHAQQTSGPSRSSQATIRPGRSTKSSRNASNTGSAVSSVVIGDPENVDDLFAYDAGNVAGGSYDPTAYTNIQTGPSTAPEGYHPSHLQVGATLAHLADSDMEYIKTETPEVKAEEDEYLYDDPL